MKKCLVVAFVLYFLSGIIPCFAENYFLESETISYNYASNLQRELNSIQRDIRLKNLEIRRIQTSVRMTQSEKNYKIKRLQREIYLQKQKAAKIKSDYRRAIS